MNKLFFPLVLVCFCSIVKAQSTDTSKADSAYAEISFESDTLNYGTIENNADGNRELKFTNTGSRSLTISQCAASCGCTVPQWPTKEIAPGESGVIKVRYNTGKIGPINGTITVYSNARTSEKTIRIIGLIEFKNAPEIANHVYSANAKSFNFSIAPTTLTIDSGSVDFIAMLEVVKQKMKSQQSTSITIESSAAFNPGLTYEENYDAPKKRAINTSKLVRRTLKKNGITVGTYYKEPIILVQGTAKDFKKKKKVKKYQYVKITVD